MLLVRTIFNILLSHFCGSEFKENQIHEHVLLLIIEKIVGLKLKTREALEVMIYRTDRKNI